MKTANNKLTTLSFTIALITFSLSTFATENSLVTFTDQAYFKEYFDYQNYTELLEIKLNPEVRIQVCNESGALIAAGSEQDEKIKSLMNHSDLLTEVNGTKYYRLSYQPTN